MNLAADSHCDYDLSTLAGTSKRPRIITESSTEITNQPTLDAHLSEQVFSIPLILKQILEYLPKRTLLITSLVNKIWNFFSREILRNEEHSLSALSIFTCEKLTFISRSLLSTENVPFNGISITIASYECQCVQADKLSSLPDRAKNLLKNVAIKYLAVQYEKPKPCVLMHFLREILDNRAVSLEGLTLNGVPTNTDTISMVFGSDVSKPNFPNLRILRFPSLYSSSTFINVHMLNRLPETLMKELILASPKLQKIYGTFSTNCLSVLLPLKSPVVLEELIFQPMVDPLDLLLQFASEKPRLKRLRFSTRINTVTQPLFHEFPKCEVQKVAQILSLLLHSSEDTLETFSADNLDLLLMTHKWSVPPLKNVTELNLAQVISYVYVVEGYLTLCKLNWDFFFPNLQQVWVTDSYFITDDYNRDFYMSREIRQNPKNYSCGTVTKIVIEATCYLREEEVDLTTLRSLFPNAKELVVDYKTSFYQIFTHILTGWSDLETLVIKFRRVESIYFNIDDYFLGVSKTETAFMSKQIQDLETYEIVPRFPSLLNFPRLKKLEIHLMHDGYLCSEDILPSNSTLISRITPLCAFSRLPDMKVEIHRRICCMKKTCHLALDHLKPFVQLINRKDSEF